MAAKQDKKELQFIGNKFVLNDILPRARDNEYYPGEYRWLDKDNLHPTYCRDPLTKDEYAAILLKKGLYIYNLHTHDLSIITLPDNLKSRDPAMVFNEEKNALYLVMGCPPIFAKVDLQTRKWTVLCGSEGKRNYKKYKKIAKGLNLKNLESLTSVFLPKSLGGLYLFGNKDESHYEQRKVPSIFSRFDQKRKQFVRLDRYFNKKDPLELPKLIYVRSLKRLLLFECSNPEKLWWIRTTKKGMEEPNWKDSGIGFPMAAEIIGTVVVFDFILIVFTRFSCDRNGIWCLDLLEKQWYDTGKHFAREDSKEHILDHCTHDLVIHILQVQPTSNDNRYHKQLRVVDILPAVLLSKLYRRLFICVSVFADRGQRTSDKIPSEIAQLILLYYMEESTLAELVKHK